MKVYLDLVKYVLDNGVRKENRTGVDTISTFAYSYKVNLSEGYPLKCILILCYMNFSGIYQGRNI